MNFVSTGVKEVTRRLRRQRNRQALYSARRSADRADTELGRRARESVQADETLSAHFETLKTFNDEIEEADAKVRALDVRLRDHEIERENARKEYQLALQQIDDERKPLRKSIEELKVRLGDSIKKLHEHTIQARALHAETTEITRADERLQSARFVDPKRDELLQGIATRREVATQRSQELDASLASLQNAKAEIEAELARQRADLLLLDQRVAQAKVLVTGRERTLTVSSAALIKEIAQLRREVGRIEQQKDPAYLHIGKAVALLETPPEGAETQYAEARRRRQSYERLVTLEAAWLRESRDANRQDLRIFKFVVVTLGVLIAGGMLLFFRTPSKRDWLPRKTETILSLNVNRFAEGDFARTLQSQEPNAWDEVWAGMLRKVAQTPGLDVRRQVSRITRALAPSPDGGPPLDYLLVEVRLTTGLEALLQQIGKTDGVWHRPVNGLTLYQKGDFALAQIGPATLAVGSPEVVEELIGVRLGLQQDLKSDDQFFTEFSGLDEQSAFRLVTQQPGTLTNIAGPFLEPTLLTKCKAVGMTLDLHEPVSAMFVLDMSDPFTAARVARQLQATPDQVLKLQSAGPNLFIEPPSVRTNDTQVEWRFKMTQPAAREFLQRISRLGAPPGEQPAVAAAPTSEAPAVTLVGSPAP